MTAPDATIVTGEGAPSSGASRTERIVVVVWDGMRPDCVTPELTPHLHAFAAGGATYRRAVGIFPAVTRTTTASFSTGSYPNAHGVIANLFVGPPGDRAPLDTGERAALERLRPGNDGRLLPVPTLAGALAAAGKRMVLLGSGTTGQITLLDPERVATTIHLAFTWPEPLLALLAARYGPPPARVVPVQAANDWLTTVLTDYVLSELDPDVAIMWLCEPDVSQHAAGLGSPTALDAIRGNDARLGRILAAIEASDVPTTVIVASDHGHSTVVGMVRTTDALAGAGFGRALERGQLLLGEQSLLVEDSPGAAGLRDAVGAWLAEQPWVGAMVTWPDPNGDTTGPSGMLTPRALWNDRLRPPLAHAPSFTYSYAWTDDPNVHGVPGSAYTGFVAARADFARLQGPIVGLNRLTSTHGTLGPRDQRIVLALGGAGIRTGRLDLPAGIVDLAPTVLALLGLPPLPDADGRVLAEALRDGPAPTSLAVRTEPVATLRDGYVRRHWVDRTAYLDTGSEG